MIQTDIYNLKKNIIETDFNCNMFSESNLQLAVRISTILLIGLPK